MNILYLSTAFSIDGAGLDSDLAEALVEAGHKVTVAAIGTIISSETFIERNGVRILNIPTPKIQKVGKFKKGLVFLSAPLLVRKAISKHLKNDSFNLILFAAPPVTLQSVLRYAKKKYSCPVYLMQKDIFPQNAVDLKMFSKRSLPYIFFRNEEKKMLKIVDIVGCMSEGNVKYLRKHNSYLKDKIIELFPNTKKILPQKIADKLSFKKKYSIPENACVFLFGGNMGKPQYAPLMLKAMKEFNGDKNVFFIFAGSGTEAQSIKNFISSKKISNAKFLEQMPREDYENLTVNCDVGLVILDYHYTIPNYPSKTLSYMECALPILASTDIHTDYKDLLETEAKCGIWTNSEKPADFFEKIKYLANNESLRLELGKNGRKYLEENFSVSRSVKILEDHFLKK